jgi:hypothetical protein
VSAADIARAKREAEIARRQLMGTVGELQERLKPATIATQAWEGVKDRSTGLADDAVQAVKSRPMAASAALGAVTLFLARSPIKSMASWLFAKKPDDDLVTTRLDKTNDNYDLTTPVVARQQDEGVSA